MSSKKLVIESMMGLVFLLLYSATAFSLFNHDSSPLFTQSFQVHSFSEKDYDTMLKGHDTVWLVDYYAPWCPHCRHFAPIWEQVAKFYASTDKVQVGAVDCTKNSGICSNESITGYPSVKIHHVPKDAAKAAMMPHSMQSVKAVINWTENLLISQGVKSGVDVKDVTAHLKNLRNDFFVTDGEDGHISYSELTRETKYRRLHDAGIAAISTFQDGFFIGANVLNGERYEVALMWVEALAAAFPLEKNRMVIAELVKAIKTSNYWTYADWKVMLNNWQERNRETTFPVNLFFSSENGRWKFCKVYTCSMWTLFHILTVNTVVNSTKSETQSWKSSRVISAIRLYVKNFFGCEECREHFMLSNPASVIDDLAMKDEEGLNAGITWMWKQHDTVNKALLKERWPSKNACPVCYVKYNQSLALSFEQLHENEIVAFAINAYGYDEEEVYDLEAAFQGALVAAWSKMQIFSAMLMVIGFFALLALAYKTRRYRGWDRKVQMVRDHTA
ncbi:uncharacterized protein CCR75_003731 [Bremia lactucae]|uniref:Sulfhydryl oxidase n=1 Tax=Bremia lactucae TaxID=4779 RepID=A0A976IGR9_BRELC|nr:hypothetical protein CCR75_003731 [Bremia lactucae]